MAENMVLLSGISKSIVPSSNYPCTPHLCRHRLSNQSPSLNFALDHQTPSPRAAQAHPHGEPPPQILIRSTQQAPSHPPRAATGQSASTRPDTACPGMASARRRPRSGPTSCVPDAETVEAAAAVVAVAVATVAVVAAAELHQNPPSSRRAKVAARGQAREANGATASH